MKKTSESPEKPKKSSPHLPDLSSLTISQLQDYLRALKEVQADAARGILFVNRELKRRKKARIAFAERLALLSPEDAPVFLD